jgi:hypothetical protein
MCISVLNGGYLLACRGNTGGVELYFISDWKPRLYAFTGEIIEGTDPGDGAAQEFFTVEQLLESASAVEAVEADTTNGAATWLQTINMVLPNTGNPDLDDQIRNFKKWLSEGRFLVITKDQNGHAKLYGAERGLTMETGEGGTGQASTDLNGNTIVLTSKESESARLVNLPGGGGGATAFITNPAPL